jgi:hypothetical protein
VISRHEQEIAARQLELSLASASLDSMKTRVAVDEHLRELVRDTRLYPSG